MILHILRALFVLLMAAAGWYFLTQLTLDAQAYAPDSRLLEHSWLALGLTLTIGVLIVCIDILSPRKKLAMFSGTFMGLMVGLAIAYAASFAVRLLIDQLRANPNTAMGLLSARESEALISFVDLVIGIICCYLSISFIIQTKDDFRFIIPYVEFKKQTKGGRPILLDTSVLIDGRIAEIAATGILDNQMVVPRFVLQELQAVADSGDRLKRNRGRRGLDILARLQNDERLDVVLYDQGRGSAEGLHEVDQRLISLAVELSGKVLTTDMNLNKIAQVRGVEVVNINDLANAVKPLALPGERMTVRLIKAGEEPGQGVGYMDDGTMVVIEQGRGRLNEEVDFVVTNTRQTSAGKMIFGRLGEGPPAAAASRRRGDGGAPQPRETPQSRATPVE
jgi:uncharacterized protein YacL